MPASQLTPTFDFCHVDLLPVMSDPSVLQLSSLFAATFHLLALQLTVCLAAPKKKRKKKNDSNNQMYFVVGNFFIIFVSIIHLCFCS